MGDRNRKNGIWHHRVPDYKLVYCGKDEKFLDNEISIKIEKKKSISFDEYTLTNSKLKKSKKI